MLLSEAISVIGDQPLNDFPWGAVVRDTVNIFAPEEFKLTLESTGDDIINAMAAVTPSTRRLLEIAEVDAARRSVTADVGGGFAMEYGEPIPLEPLYTKVNIITGLVVGNVVIAAIIAAASLTGNRNTDWGGIKGIAGDIIKSLIGF